MNIYSTSIYPGGGQITLINGSGWGVTNNTPVVGMIYLYITVSSSS